MTIITNEMKKNAEKFILRWRGTTTERAEAQTFSNEFFQIFELDRLKLAKFEKAIQKKDESGTGFADLFWSGKLIIESKSAHLDKATHWEKTLKQATDYIDNLLEHQKPQYILLMNFKRIQKYEVIIDKNGKTKINHIIEIPLEKLVENIEQFSFFIEFANRLETDEEKVNQEAAKRIANVYDAIEREGYSSIDISVLLARILFCLFAEDTGIFERKLFEKYIIDNTTGENLGKNLLKLFDILNTPENLRDKKNTALNAFPYVNGDLFNSKLNKIPPISSAARDALIECCKYDWSDISPVILGALFQAVMNNAERRSLGAHYTSEKNILRVLRPLFLDKLQEEFDGIKENAKALEKFRKKINEMLFLDPACGCGNFLVVTYRELRLLDIEIIRKKYKGTYMADSSLLSNVPLTNFYGYEIDPTSAMIAEVAMWLMQHQMNMRLESEFGTAVPTIPLREAAEIENVNSLRKKWAGKTKFKKGVGEVETIFDYILGNPPFIGKQLKTEQQKEDTNKILKNIKGAGVLDYVSCWFFKAAEYMDENPNTKTALVSSNSISQGEQAGIIWHSMFTDYKLKIQFAHQTFKWLNEAEGVAAVHCIVIGFGKENLKEKLLFEYSDINSEPEVVRVKNINPYLVQGNDTIILKRRKPICNVSEISFGSMPNDGGHLLFTDEEKELFLEQEPLAKPWVKPLISAHEYLNGKKRWCLWLEGAKASEIKKIKGIYRRVLAVQSHRNDSTREATQKLASKPTLFGEIRQPKGNYILIPLHSSENRKYIPIGFFDKNYIANNSTSVVPNATLYEFGILTSRMHMTWVKYVCGRIKSDYRYSNEIVYNNFPWPSDIAAKNKVLVEKLAQEIISIRKKHFAKGSNYSDIYNPALMPQDLLKAHTNLDKAVDKCYSDLSFNTEPKRLEFLFKKYEDYSNGLFK